MKNNNLNQINAVQNSLVQVDENILEIGTITDLTLGRQGTYFEKRTSGFYEPDCVIMKIESPMIFDNFIMSESY